MSDEYVISIEVWADQHDVAQDLLSHLRTEARRWCANEDEIEISKVEMFLVEANADGRPV